MIREQLLADLRELRRADDDAVRDAIARDISVSVQRLLREKLAGDERWNRFWWFDGAVSVSFDVVSPRCTEVRGLLWWDEGRTQWRDPFFAQLHTSDDGRELTLCTIAFGSVNGLRNDRASPVWLDEWLFVFSE